MAKFVTPNDLLLAVSFRFYATEMVNVAEKCFSRGVPIVAITDSTPSPLAKNAALLFTAPEHGFLRSFAAPMCLAQALTIALAARLQNADKPRIPVVTQP